MAASAAADLPGLVWHHVCSLSRLLFVSAPACLPPAPDGITAQHSTAQHSTEQHSTARYLRSLPFLPPSIQVFLLYHFEREVAPAVKKADWEKRPFGAHMDVAALVAAQTRIERQDAPHAASASFDFAAANAFQGYVSSAIAFSIKRGGILYGTGAAGRVAVHGLQACRA
jgi:hypothetical protein